MADMNVARFKGMIKDLARPNRFRVVITRLGIETEFLCKATEVPTGTIEPMDVNYMGRVLKYPGDRSNPDWSVTCYGDMAFSVYGKLEQWQTEMNDPEGNFQTPQFATASKSSGEIQQLDRQGNVIKTWKVEGIFPSELGSLPLDWGTNSSTMEFNVTFACDYIIPSPSNLASNG